MCTSSWESSHDPVGTLTGQEEVLAVPLTSVGSPLAQPSPSVQATSKARDSKLTPQMLETIHLSKFLWPCMAKDNDYLDPGQRSPDPNKTTPETLALLTYLAQPST